MTQSSNAPVVDRIRIIPRPDDFLNRNVGSSGEVFYNKQSDTLRVYSGKIAGGYELARADLNNISDADFLAKAVAAGVGGGTGGGAQVDVSDTAPVSPTEGNIWFDSTSGKIYVYIDDGDSQQWVQPSFPVFSGDYGDLTSKPTSITAFGITDGTSGQVLTTDGAGHFSFADSATSNQNLNTTDDVVFNSISATEFTNIGTGTPELDSASSLTLSAPDGIILNGVLRFASYTTPERDALISSAGDVVWNTTASKLQVYNGSTWADLH